MAERGRRWFAITWIGLLFLVHVLVLYSAISELISRHDHGAHVAIGPALLAVVPVVIKTGCLILIVMRSRAGWYGYLLTTVVLALVTFVIAGQNSYGRQASGADLLIGLVVAWVTTWLLWVAIAPRWKSFR